MPARVTFFRAKRFLLALEMTEGSLLGCSSNQTCFLPLPPLVISTPLSAEALAKEDGRNLAIPATPEQAVPPQHDPHDLRRAME